MALGIVMVMITSMYMIYILFTYFYTDQAVKGWASQAILISFFSGLQLLMIGILGEYISKIFKEVKDRSL